MAPSHYITTTMTELSLVAHYSTFSHCLSPSFFPLLSFHSFVLSSLHPSFSPLETDFPKVAGEISSFDEDSSDTLSPDQPIGQESPLGHAPLPSPHDALACNSTPTQFLTQVPPPPPPLPPFYGPCQPVKLSNGTAVLRAAPALNKVSGSCHG